MHVSSEVQSAPARSRAATRRRLLAAGTELFARDGLHGATSAQIARRAGVAAGTFYLHFRDKQALFRAIVFDAIEQLRQRLDRVTADAGGDPRAGLRARTAEMLAFAEKHRSGVRILFGRDREAADLGEDVWNDLLPGVEARLRQNANGHSATELHPKVAAQAFLAMWTRVVTWWVENPRRASREAVIDTLTNLYAVSAGGRTNGRPRSGKKGKQRTDGATRERQKKKRCSGP